MSMELHLVHVNAAGNISVVAIFIQSGNNSPFLDNLITILPQIPRSSNYTVSNTTVGTVRLDLLVNEVENWVSYTGSLTTPPCSENVIWFISTDILNASQSQIDSIVSAIPFHNNRPLQNLNGRAIYAYNETFAMSTSTTTTVISTTGSTTSSSSVLQIPYFACILFFFMQMWYYISPS